MSAPRPVSRFIDTNGVRLHVLDFGGDGPPAVLHHATGFHAWVWAPIAASLSRRHHVFAVDARGHGDSEKPAGGYHWETFIADLVGVVETLGLSGTLGVGHSLGGTTTAGAAAARPDLFGALALLDPIVVPREFHGVPETQNPMAAIARKRRETWTSSAEVLDSYRGRGVFAKWRDDVLRLYVEHGFASAEGGVRLKCPPAVEAQVFGMAPQFDLWAMLDEIRLPTLLVRGEESTVFSTAHAAEVARHLARSEIRTIPGATHTFPMESPDAVAAEILDFARAALPLPVRGLAHVALNAEKLDETVLFYEQVFGMRVVWRPDADNVYLSSGRDNLALHRAREPRAAKGSPLDHLGFLVDTPEQVFEAAEALARRGIAVARPPRHHRDGSCSLYVEDPDGNLVQILYEPNASRSIPQDRSRWSRQRR